MTASRSIQLLQRHAHRLSPDKQAVARYVCENWPLQQRLPKGVADKARLAYDRSVINIADAHIIARELFLEAANLARISGKAEA